MSPILLTLIQTLFVVAVAPFTLGFVRWCKARLQGRHGASPFLPYWSFATLLRKEMVISPTTSWVFTVVPYGVLASTLVIAAALPLLSTGGALSGLSDFVLIAGLLAIGAILLVLGGLDPGSAFGGMGAAREMTIAALLEPAVILAFGSIALVTGSSRIDQMLASSGIVWTHPSLWLALLALVLIALAENARYPVDNPATHLELTMVHEAMVLEYSGPYLAMLEYASALKLTIFTLLLGRLVVTVQPIGTGSGLVEVGTALLVGVVTLIVGMGLLALLESTIAKMRFYRMQEYTGLALLIGFVGVCLSLLIRFV